jgi:predicted RNA-binding Zn-ribbon protein involved in translation (DUF1610 family)
VLNTGRCFYCGALNNVLVIAMFDEDEYQKALADAGFEYEAPVSEEEKEAMKRRIDLALESGKCAKCGMTLLVTPRRNNRGGVGFLCKWCGWFGATYFGNYYEGSEHGCNNDRLKSSCDRCGSPRGQVSGLICPKCGMVNRCWGYRVR